VGQWRKHAATVLPHHEIIFPYKYNRLKRKLGSYALIMFMEGKEKNEVFASSDLLQSLDGLREIREKLSQYS
jgi:hypothetical protein